MLCVLHSLSHLWESDYAVGKDLRYVSVALIDFIDRQSFCMNPHSQMSLHGLAVFAVLALACHELGGMSSLSSPEHSASLTRSSKRTRTGQRQVRASSPLGTQQGKTSRHWNQSREKHFHHVSP